MGLTHVRREIGRKLPWLRPLAGPVYGAYVRGLCRLIGLGDRRFMRRTGTRLLPPVWLRHRVGGGADPAVFINSGLRSAESIEAALMRVGRTPDSFDAMLDFGCGCGRLFIALHDRPRPGRMIGTDLDAEAIAWCRAHLDGAEFHINEPLPPLPVEEGLADLVTALSVFTHLDEEYQFRWLEELARVSRQGAVLLLSTHGAHAQSTRLSPGEQAQLERQGILHYADYAQRSIFHESYRMTFHTREYVEREWSRLFRILAYLPRGLGDYQDLVVLQKE